MAYELVKNGYCRIDDRVSA